MGERKTQTESFELRKDINGPQGYFRAGLQKSRNEWEKLFPKSFTNSLYKDEWFVLVSDVDEDKDPLNEYLVIKKVFEEQGLHSITYKEAAAKCMRIWADKNIAEDEKGIIKLIGRLKEKVRRFSETVTTGPEITLLNKLTKELNEELNNITNP